MADFRVISIGALSVHELWDRPAPPRTAHATTTLITAGDRRILVDPALPAQALVPRLEERCGLGPGDITDVFLTCFRPAHRMGLEAFDGAKWWIGEREREAVGGMLVERFQNEPAGSDEAEIYRKEVALLQRCEAAPDKLADRVDLFPLPGFTPGTCGLLIPESTRTVLIAGDAVPTVEHLQRGRVLRGAYDAESAMESLKEAIEIADVIVPGHDNVVLNPMGGRG
jgi:glyoxylase-like metal-dependent hydrolase (beta-lactamase superfamily II)